MKRILFVDERNNGPSQIAEAFFNYYAKGKAQASSAGIHYTNYIDPIVVQAMKEVGIDLSEKRPKVTTTEMVGLADKIISIGCGKVSICPSIFITIEEWQGENPTGRSIDKVRTIRDEIKAKVLKLIEDMLSYTGEKCLHTSEI